MVAQTLLLLLKTGINLNKKNLEDKTALDIASTPEIKNILLSVGAKPSLEVPGASKLPHWLRSETSFYDKLRVVFVRIRNNLTEDQRNIWLLVGTLIATTMFESALTPPGGVYQISAGDSNLNITSSNSTISTLENVGQSVMPVFPFMIYSTINVICFLISTIGIITIASNVPVVGTMYTWFFFCYLFSMLQIAPSIGKVIGTLFALFISMPLVSVALMCPSLIKRVRTEQKLSKYHSLSIVELNRRRNTN